MRLNFFAFSILSIVYKDTIKGVLFICREEKKQIRNISGMQPFFPLQVFVHIQYRYLCGNSLDKRV